MLGLGWLANQIGRLGGAVKGGFRNFGQQVGQMRQQGGPGQYRTPGFNPNARTGDDGDDLLNRQPKPWRMETPEMQEMAAPIPMSRADDGAFEYRRPGTVSASTNAGDIPLQVSPRPITPIYDPTPQRPSQMAIRNGQQEFYQRSPQGGNLRRMMDDSVKLHEQMRSQIQSATSINPSTIQAPVMRELPGARVEDVPIPSLPGIPGGPQPYDPIAKERFDYIYSRMPKDEAGMERKHTFGERIKAGLMPMLAGAARGAQASPNNPLWGAIGGAGTGFGLGAINPNAGSLVSFNTFTEPRLQADQQRRDQDYQRGVQREREGLSVEKDRSDIDYRRAQADATRAGMKDAQLEREYRRSQIALNDARAQAVATGKPVVRDIVDESGQIRTYQVYPDGSAVPLGGSARAAINTQNVESREKVAEGRNQTAVQTTQIREAGATGRTAMTQAGQNARAAAKTGGDGGGPAPAGKRKTFIDRAVGAGYSRAEAEAEANRRGLK